MNKKIQLHGYNINFSPVEISITKRNGSVIVKPGEVNSLQDAVAAISGLKDVEAKPPYINYTPFRVFLEEDAFYVARNDGETLIDTTTALEVPWESRDNFMQVLEQCLNIAKDERRLRPGVRSGGWSPSDKGIVIG